MPHTTISPDGSFDFSGGVDSSKVTTVQSDLTPNGLRRNQLAWLDNATVRGGGINCRTGWENLFKLIATGLFQSGYLYEPKDGSNPYLVVSISGLIYTVLLDPPYTITLRSGPATTNSITTDYGYMAQAEEFLIIQSGDGATLPLFWDGAALRRSKGITNTAVAPGTPGVNEIPAATAMDYFQGRLWYAQGRNYSAGDIVKGNSGTAAYAFRDAVLNVTENPLCAGGDGFTVPSNAGNIRALKHSANINATLGEGNLYIFTRKSIYMQQVPVTRTDWIGADTNNGPRQEVVQIVNGSVNDRSIVAVNGDLFYQSLEPAVRSLSVAVRNFQQWGNKPISANEDRALQFNDRSLMRFCSGIEFNNRLWEGILPKIATDGINIVSQAVAVLDFDLISSFDVTLPPAWEGMYEGLQILQLFKGDFGGRDRAFALVVSDVDNSIEVWELTIDQRFDRPTGLTGPENRVQWYVEFPAFTWGKEFELKKLDGGQMWIDKIFGTTEFTFYYRSDADPCWHLWFFKSICAAKNCVEDVHCPSGYPLNFREGYKFALTFPAPPGPCDSMGERPSTIGYQHQLRVVVKGWARIRGLILFAQPRNTSQFEDMACDLPTNLLTQ